MNNFVFSQTSEKISSARIVHSVGQLNQLVRTLLEDTLAILWIEGEISNFVCPSSGHWYFTLKDASAQVRCAMFQGRNRLLSFSPKNGAKVLVRAKVTLYEARGEYQLVVDFMEEAGAGALRCAFELLKTQLAAEGLFDPQFKKAIPRLPKTIGVVTSPTGAAVRDILSVLKRRFPGIPVIIYPTAVQGAAAAIQIVNALETAQRRKECDVIVLARGGGSLEDLWPFNEEIVARAIFACEIPLISAVGHEIDFTIADFVADQRAPTPSAAAELASPDQMEWLQKFAHLSLALKRQIEAQLIQQQQRLLMLSKRLRHPGQRLQDQAQRLDDLETRLRHAFNHYLHRKISLVQALYAKLQRHHPQFKLELLQAQQKNLKQRLRQNMQQILHNKQQKLMSTSRALDAISPLATLARGYAIVTLPSSKNVLIDAQQINPGDYISVHLNKGQLLCQVCKIEK